MLDLMMDKVLSLAALVLSVVNGFILVYNFLCNRPKLLASSQQPESYQRWVRLKDVQRDGKDIRRYAFISYFSVANAGFKDVAVESWRLHIKNKLFLRRFWHKKKELKPYNIPEPQCQIGNHVKLMRVFGQNTQNFESFSNMVKSGDSISGMACWIYSVWGGEGWSPQTNKNNDIIGILVIGDVFGGEAKCKLVFREITLERLQSVVPTLGEYLENSDCIL